jgi:hypothetical protein
MRTAAHFLAAAVVAAMAFWAYRVNYDTQAALDRVDALRAEIARERDAIRVLEAEWAWLNAPERLQRLVDANAAALGLEPMSGERYADIAEIPLPQEPEPEPEPETLAAATEARP